jgi:hypothetical protein
MLLKQGVIMSTIMNKLVAALSEVGTFVNKNAMSETLRDIMIGRDYSRYIKYISPTHEAPKFSSPFFLNGNDKQCYMAIVYSEMKMDWKTEKEFVHNHFGIYCITERINTKGIIINEEIDGYEEGGANSVLSDDMKGEVLMWYNDEYVISGDDTNHAMEEECDDTHVDWAFNIITEYKYVK